MLADIGYYLNIYFLVSVALNQCLCFGIFGLSTSEDKHLFISAIPFVSFFFSVGLPLVLLIYRSFINILGIKLFLVIYIGDIFSPSFTSLLTLSVVYFVE